MINLLQCFQTTDYSISGCDPEITTLRKQSQKEYKTEGINRCSSGR